MHFLHVLALAVAILALALGLVRAVEAAQAETPVAIAPAPEMIYELSAVVEQHPLWPGYSPFDYPIAIYDGHHTYLFHHPAPPDGFAPSEEHLGVLVYPGRYPAVVANTAVDIGGVVTATFMFNAGASGRLHANAAVIAHETFHVYQHAKHPSWSANEAELFTFPMSDPVWLAARRLEQEAYLAALAAPDTQQCAAWTAQALRQRAVWAGVLTPEQQAYLCELERMEGLAAYLQTVVEHPSAPDPGILGNGDFTPAETRRQSYYMGTLQALLLDRLAPGWQQRLEDDDTQYLTDMLAAALPADAAPEQFTPGRLAKAQAQAGQASAGYAEGLAQQRADFDALPGWRVIMLAEISPLWPQGFDPMNILNLGGGELLHQRFLRLGNDCGALELMDGQAITLAAGEHPLLNGVARATFGGLSGEPQVYEDERRTKLVFDNFTLEFSPALLERTGEQEYTVRVMGPQPR